MALLNQDIKKKNRILLIVRWPVGGIRTFIRYMYPRFAPSLYHFTILGPDNLELEILRAELTGMSFDVKKMTKEPNAREIFLCIFRLLLKEHYDLVHSHGLTSGVCAALPAAIFRVPHVLTTHDMFNAKQFYGIYGFTQKFLVMATIKIVDAIHFVSFDNRKNLLQFFPSLSSSSKTKVIMNGIETGLFANSRASGLREELGADNNVFLIGFLGRFMSPKGFVYLVDAIDIIRHAGPLPKKLLVVTFGEGGFVREEKAALVSKGLADYFVFLPLSTDVPGILKSLDLVAMPSIWESCGLLAMEALVAGTPLITSDCPGLREVTASSPAKVVPARNSKALAEGIMEFMLEDRSATFKDYAPIAARRFEVTASSEALEQLYQKLISE